MSLCSGHAAHQRGGGGVVRVATVVVTIVIQVKLLLLDELLCAPSDSVTKTYVVCPTSPTMKCWTPFVGCRPHAAPLCSMSTLDKITYDYTRVHPRPPAAPPVRLLAPSTTLSPSTISLPGSTFPHLIGTRVSRDDRITAHSRDSRVFSGFYFFFRVQKKWFVCPHRVME